MQVFLKRNFTSLILQRDGLVRQHQKIEIKNLRVVLQGINLLHTLSLRNFILLALLKSKRVLQRIEIIFHSHDNHKRKKSSLLRVVFLLKDNQLKATKNHVIK